MIVDIFKKTKNNSIYFSKKKFEICILKKYRIIL